MAFDQQKHKLEGSSTRESGGLILSKKRSNIDDDDGFKKPNVSMLGLDVLAREKRKQKEAEKTEGVPVEKKRRQEHKREQSRSDNREGGVRISFGSKSSKDRQYRLVKLVN